jgi:hypothetical protein
MRDTHTIVSMSGKGDFDDRPALSPGYRVKVVLDPDWEGPWPAQPLGVIEPIMGEPYRTIDLRDRTVNVPSSDRHLMREYLVQFDEPQRDTDGDGPYSSAVIWEKYLRPLDEFVTDDSDETRWRRLAGDTALREVIKSPEKGERRE